MKKTLLILLAVFNLLLNLQAQGYQSTYGSPYAGSTGIRNNPAASINSAYQWDLTVLTVQARNSTNSLYLKNDSLRVTSPYEKRFLHNNIDVSILNFLYKLNNRQAITFNLRGRAYNHIRTEAVSSNDSIYSVNDFLLQNRTTPFLEGFVTHSGWLEADLNYATILSETLNSRLTAGVTLQVMKGVSGAFGRLSKMSYLELKSSADTIYTFISGGGSFGYSSNYDETSSGTSSSAKDFIRNSRSALGLSLGVEYLLYDGTANGFQQNNPLNYAWKIGVSVMDLGANRFKASEYSTQFRNINSGISSTTVDTKFTNIETGRDLRDSLATIFNTAEKMNDRFKIGNPTRLIINVDRNFGNHWYVNADLNINLHGTSGYKKLLTRELSLLTITPRWESLNWGLYLPIQYNSQNQLHIGAAIKAGPLVVGLHNLQWVKQIKNLSGGGYLMLSIHPFNKKKVVSKLDCPE